MLLFSLFVLCFVFLSIQNKPFLINCLFIYKICTHTTHNTPHTHSHTLTHTCTLTHVCTHTHTHTHIHTHTLTDTISDKNVLKLVHIPVHVLPFPVKPVLQVQVKDPGVLWQSAFVWQSLPPVTHSSMSIINEKLTKSFSYVLKIKIKIKHCCMHCK